MEYATSTVDLTVKQIIGMGQDGYAHRCHTRTRTRTAYAYLHGGNQRAFFFCECAGITCWAHSTANDIVFPSYDWSL